MDIQLDRIVEVDGARIRYGASGSGESDILLVHGNGAHHMWWHRVAEILEPDFRLITLDLSGHGESDRRATYLPTLWSREVAAVLDAAGSEHPLFVGHSMGGRLALRFATLFPERARGLVVFDASVRPPSRFRTREQSFSTKPLNVYSSWGQARSRFRLLPVQPDLPLDILDPIARYSIRTVEGGWSWKHDPDSLLRFDDAKVAADAQGLRTPLVYVYGSESIIVDDELADFVRGTVPSLIDVIRIDGGYHHLILDHPERCAQIIAESATSVDAADSAMI